MLVGCAILEGEERQILDFQDKEPTYIWYNQRIPPYRTSASLLTGTNVPPLQCPSSPLAAAPLYSVSVSLTYLDISCKWIITIFVVLRLAHFT